MEVDVFEIGSRVKHKDEYDDEEFTVISKEEYLLGGGHSPEGEDIVYVKDDSGVALWNDADNFELVSPPKANKSKFAVGSKVVYDGETFAVITHEEYLDKHKDDYGVGTRSPVVFVKSYRTGSVFWVYEHEISGAELTINDFPVGSKVRALIEPYSTRGLFTVIGEDEVTANFIPVKSNAVYVRADDDGQIYWAYPHELEITKETPVKETARKFSPGDKVFYLSCSEDKSATVVSEEEYLKNGGTKDYGTYDDEITFVRVDETSAYWWLYTDSLELAEEPKESESKIQTTFPVGSKVVLSSDPLDYGVFTVIDRKEYKGYDSPLGPLPWIYVKNDRTGHVYKDSAVAYRLATEETPKETPKTKFPLGSRVSFDSCGGEKKEVTVISRDEYLKEDDYAPSIKSIVFVRYDDGGVYWLYEDQVELVEEAIDPKSEFEEGDLVKYRYGGELWRIISEKTYLAAGNSRKEGKDIIYIQDEESGRITWGFAKNNELVEKAAKKEASTNEMEPETPEFEVGDIIRYKPSGSLWEVISREEFLKKGGKQPHKVGMIYMKPKGGSSVTWGWADKNEPVEKAPKAVAFPVGSYVKLKDDPKRLFVVVSKQEFKDYYKFESDLVPIKELPGDYVYHSPEDSLMLSEAPAENSEDPFAPGNKVKYGSGCGSSKTYTVITREEFEKARPNDRSGHETAKFAIYLKEANGDVSWTDKRDVKPVVPKGPYVLPEGYAVGDVVKYKTGSLWTVVSVEEFEKSGKARREDETDVLYLKENGNVSYYAWGTTGNNKKVVVPEDSPFAIGSKVKFGGCSGNKIQTVITRAEFEKAKPDDRSGHATVKNAVYLKDKYGAVSWARQEDVKLDVPREPYVLPEGYEVGDTVQFIDGSLWTVVSSEEYEDEGSNSRRDNEKGLLYLKSDRGSYAAGTTKNNKVVKKAAGERTDGKFPLGSFVKLKNSARIYKVVSKEAFKAAHGYDSTMTPIEDIEIGKIYHTPESTLVSAEAPAEAPAEDNLYAPGKQVQYGGCSGKKIQTIITREEFKKAKPYDRSGHENYPTAVYLKDKLGSVSWALKRDVVFVDSPVETVKSSRPYVLPEGFKVGDTVKYRGDGTLWTVVSAEEYEASGKKRREDESQKLYLKSLREGRYAHGNVTENTVVKSASLAKTKLSAESQGRLNIPAELIRDVLGAEAGDKVYVQFLKDKLVLTTDKLSPNIEKDYTVTVRGNIRISAEVLELLDGEGDYSCEADSNTLVIKAVETALW